MHTLLCLMAKGLHCENPGKKSDNNPERVKRHAHLEVATALNKAVYGDDFENDISKREISKMIDKILEERKAIFGSGGYMDRSVPGRITRGLKLMWERSTKFDFDGSMAEWKLGRKAKEMGKLGIIIEDTLVDNTVEEGEIALDDADDSDKSMFIPLVYRLETNQTLLTNQRSSKKEEGQVFN